eukprot:TRINITY_DN4631_c0_g1_i1.p1 TRINITY_DN4631_c0_g1~~TRINITY_DN4631_c0_g1_i1.p1  ORF type:complete len:306 (-),score=31.20 TRINITY_DN4631_c0_g1_i1:8-925(-)
MLKRKLDSLSGDVVSNLRMVGYCIPKDICAGIMEYFHLSSLPRIALVSKPFAQLVRIEIFRKAKNDIEILQKAVVADKCEIVAASIPMISAEGNEAILKTVVAFGSGAMMETIKNFCPGMSHKQNQLKDALRYRNYQSAKYLVENGAIVITEMYEFIPFSTIPLARLLLKVATQNLVGTYTMKKLFKNMENILDIMLPIDSSSTKTMNSFRRNLTEDYTKSIPLVTLLYEYPAAITISDLTSIVMKRAFTRPYPKVVLQWIFHLIMRNNPSVDLNGTYQSMIKRGKCSDNPIVRATIEEITVSFT